MSEPSENSTNGLGNNPLQRLASFKTPRDLTLGGVKPNKKVFTPNLNVSRNKNKSSSSINSRDQKKDKQNRDKRNDRSKSLKNGPNIIKSSGVFSEGLGSIERHSSNRSYISRDAEPTASVQKPTLRIRNFVKADKELEDQKIRQVFGSTSTGEDEAVEDFRNPTEKDAPIKLPMDIDSWSKNLNKPHVKKEVTVKLEPQDGDCATGPPPPVEVKAEVKSALFENTDAVRVLRSEEPTLILLQLPDTLPGRGGSVDDEPNRNQQAATSTVESTDKTTETRCRLADLEEGKIGKLQIHQSGRVTMMLGDTVFEVSSGTRPCFHQELVSVASDDASRSANLIALGSLTHKLNVVPHWEQMFVDMAV